MELKDARSIFTSVYSFENPLIALLGEQPPGPTMVRWLSPENNPLSSWQPTMYLVHLILFITGYICQYGLEHDTTTQVIHRACAYR